MAFIKEMLLSTLEELLEAELKTFQWNLSNNYKDITKSEMENADRLRTVDKMVECFGTEEAVRIMIETLKRMNKNFLSEQLELKYNQGSTKDDYKTTTVDYLEISNRLKNQLMKAYRTILTGNSDRGCRECLDEIFTDIYMVKNEIGGIVTEHEVRQIEQSYRQFNAKDKPIHCNDIFTSQHQKKVLTLGIAGVGKTVSVSKFILDWANGQANQDIVFIFPLPFRRLNMIREEYSLMDLLQNIFFTNEEKLPSLPQDDGKVLFIFDGLDECRFHLSFDETYKPADVRQKTTVSRIVANLIEGYLFPSSLVWVTSRPAAQSKIPRDYIDLVTEVRGFRDEQKEEYFNKNCSPELAGKIISHIRKSRSLYIMCHIPIFCWISRIVLQALLTHETNDKTPTTLTGIYINFLITQQQQMKMKYSHGLRHDEIVLKLGKLAFQQLKKGNLIFYQEDLLECGLTVNDGTVYSGLCTLMFQEEKVSARKVYSFIHLSVQEFLAALFVFFTYKNEKRNPFLDSWKKLRWIFFSKSQGKLHKTAIKNALLSENGHLDLFLRFLLGLSVEPNQSDLKDLLPELKLKTESVEFTVEYLKKKIEMEESAERTINLFHCLNELRDDSVEEIQRNLSSGNLSGQNLSSTQWSALVFLLLMSDETQKRFELQKYGRSDETLSRLLPVIKNTNSAL